MDLQSIGLIVSHILRQIQHILKSFVGFIGNYITWYDEIYILGIYKIILDDNNNFFNLILDMKAEN